MEQKKKQKERKAAQKDSKEPSQFKKPAPPVKPFKPAAPVEKTVSFKTEADECAGQADSVEETVSAEPEANDTTSQTESVEAPKSLKRKASDSEIKEEDAKKHKTNDETQPAQRPIKPFAPRPRATRGLKSTRGKSLKLTGTRSLNKNNAAETTNTPAEKSTVPEGGNTNDHFRDLMLGKK